MRTQVCLCCMEEYLDSLIQYPIYVWVVLGAFLFVFGLQLYFYLRYFYGIARLKKRMSRNDVRLTTAKPPVSVIICARNESENLARFLPSVLGQLYPKFEVIVVNDGSTDESTDLLKNLMEKYPNLYQTFLPMGAKYVSRKKMCLSVGIKAAHYDHLLFLDADCEPASKQWLASMMRSYASGTSVVLGYCGHKQNEGFLDKLIAYDVMFQAMRFIGFALCGKPYRGTAGNLSYKKSLYETKGFTSHLNLEDGDDDLLIRDIATGANTFVSADANAVTWSHRDISMKSFMYQRERQMSTYAEYKFGTKFRISMEMISRFAYYLLAALCVGMFAMMGDWIAVGVTAFIALMRYVMQLVIFNYTSKALEERKFVFSIPLFDIILPFFTLYARLSERFGPKKVTVWQEA